MEASAGAPGGREVEWQLDAIDLRPVDRWLRPYLTEGGPGGLQIRPQPTRTLVDVYVDTDDWRLYRAGYSLRFRRRGREAEATLKSLAPATEGPRVRRELTEALPGVDLDALPASGGDVGARVAAVAGKRPLRRLFEVRTRRRTYQVVEGEGSGPVAEIALDDTAIGGGEGEEPARLRRVEIELLDAEPDRLDGFVRAMAGDCGLWPATLSKFEAGLLALGLEPPAPPDLGPTEVAPTASVGELAFAIMRRQFTAVLSKEPGTRLGEDPEEVHDMRVAIRRIRAAMALFSDALPVRMARARDELKWVAGTLGAVRDLDVQLERLDDWIRDAAPEDREPLAALRGLLEEERAAARRAMLEALDSSRYVRLADGFGALLRRGPLRTAPASRMPAVVAAPDLVRARRRKVRKAARHLRAPEEFHRLRIRCKRFRYSLEFVSELYGDAAQPLVKRLVKLQDVLGLLQDSYVAVNRLRQLAGTEGLPPASVFAMGQVAERYAQQAARLERRVPKTYRKVRGKPWRELRTVMERERARAPWVERRAPLRPVAPAPAAEDVPAATPGMV